MYSSTEQKMLSRCSPGDDDFSSLENEFQDMIMYFEKCSLNRELLSVEDDEIL